MFSPVFKMFSCVLVVVIASAFAIFAGSARADPATPSPNSGCSADSNAGSGNIVWKDGQLVVSGCHTGSSSFSTTIPVQSGDCHGAITPNNENIVCVKQ